MKVEQVNRDELITAFIRRASIYKAKQEERSHDNVDRHTRWEMSLMAREAIDHLAAEIGILDDMQAAGYIPTD